MTKAEREARVAEAIEWMREDDPPAGSGQRAACSKFPGWNVDVKIDGALLECILTIHPRANLVGVLAAMRMHWLPQGRTTTRAWRARLRNWCSARNAWDPLLSGPVDQMSKPGPQGPVFGGDEVPSRRRPRSAERPAMDTPASMGDIVHAELAKMKRLVGDQ